MGSEQLLLVESAIFVFLVLYVLLDRLFVDAHGGHKIPAGPEMLTFEVPFSPHVAYIPLDLLVSFRILVQDSASEFRWSASS